MTIFLEVKLKKSLILLNSILQSTSIYQPVFMYVQYNIVTSMFPKVTFIMPHRQMDENTLQVENAHFQ